MHARPSYQSLGNTATRGPSAKPGWGTHCHCAIRPVGRYIRVLGSIRAVQSVHWPRGWHLWAGRYTDISLTMVYLAFEVHRRTRPRISSRELEGESQHRTGIRSPMHKQHPLPARDAFSSGDDIYAPWTSACLCEPSSAVSIWGAQLDINAKFTGAMVQQRKRYIDRSG